MTLSIIVAVGKSWQIGKNNELLWHIPEDLKLFKAITSGHHVVMGRRTYESIGKPLPNRISIVLSKNRFKSEGAQVVESLKEAIEFCVDNGENEAFIIGGGEIYKEAIKSADRIYLTTVDSDIQGDVFFPPVNFREWQIIDEKKFDESINKNGEKIPAWQRFVLQRLPK